MTPLEKAEALASASSDGAVRLWDVGANPARPTGKDEEK
jgi:hypothetical protein